MSIRGSWANLCCLTTILVMVFCERFPKITSMSTTKVTIFLQFFLLLFINGELNRSSTQTSFSHLYPCSEIICLALESQRNTFCSPLSPYLADTGKARDRSTNPLVSDSFTEWSFFSSGLWSATRPQWLEIAIPVKNLLCFRS